MEKNLTEVPEKIFVINSQRNYFLKYFVFNILNEFSFPYSRIIAFICVSIEVINYVQSQFCFYTAFFLKNYYVFLLKIILY